MDSRNNAYEWMVYIRIISSEHYSFEGMKLMGPHDPYPYLIRHYGRNWKTPKKHKNHQKQIFKKHNKNLKDYKFKKNTWYLWN